MKGYPWTVGGEVVTPRSRSLPNKKIPDETAGELIRVHLPSLYPRRSEQNQENDECTPVKI
ncbi:MAG: hypothetical protein HC769_05375 [Cyanobacteria bacterium CRU_2_1]|nr:hypothetical protein [Cyanobacteria bacterium RU_5_0]NJR58328.1 hypothetical protein [Cyanobacteria bacterium CRU_2_1]